MKERSASLANRSTGRRLDDASIRRILRRYGAKFEFTEGEVPDEEVTPPKPPTP